MDDIEQDLEEFANYILEEIKQSEGEISNWDEIIRKWKEIEKKKDLALRKKLNERYSMNSSKQNVNQSL